MASTILFFTFLGIALLLVLAFMAEMAFLIYVSKKTHAILEFKASLKRQPIALFFSDNKYVDWKNETPEVGLIEDEQYGYFIIDATYIDAKTKNVYIPFNTAFAISLNVKTAKLADDLKFIMKNQNNFTNFKMGILKDKVDENDGLDTLRTTVDFSSIKHFVSPLLPHGIKSKVLSTVKLRLKDSGTTNIPNIILYCIAALGALILGGILMKFILG
jgi:hypothetical protein